MLVCVDIQNAFCSKEMFREINYRQKSCQIRRDWIMPRTGENIYKRKDGRWEGRYIKEKNGGKAKYGSVYARSYKESWRKQKKNWMARSRILFREKKWKI